jgi:hypothetical protein
MKKTTFELTYKKEILLSIIDDMLITALEGGSNYWYILDHTKVETPENFKRNKDIDKEWLDKIYQGSSIDIFDLENPDEKLGELNVENINKGLRLIENIKDKYLLKCILQEEYDAGDADNFFQYIVLGEITFG